MKLRKQRGILKVNYKDNLLFNEWWNSENKQNNRWIYNDQTKDYFKKYNNKILIEYSHYDIIKINMNHNNLGFQQLSKNEYKKRSLGESFRAYPCHGRKFSRFGEFSEVSSSGRSKRGRNIYHSVPGLLSSDGNSAVMDRVVYGTLWWTEGTSFHSLYSWLHELGFLMEICGSFWNLY